MKAASLLVPGACASSPVRNRKGIIDIGSNSIRLVVFDGPDRMPVILFNEKVMAGLGRGLSRDGLIHADAVERAVGALRRFRLLAEQMEVRDLRTVATAALREAANGQDVLDRIAETGLSPEVISGEEEARISAHGVLSAIPDANGIVGDLGGGSLELVRVHDGAVHQRASFPLGVLRIAALRERGSSALGRRIEQLVAEHGWLAEGRGLPFYMVGGSWRALARLNMHLDGYPLPILHHYRMAAGQADHLVRVLAQLNPKKLRDIPGLSQSRIPTLGDGALLLSALARKLLPSELIVSAYGLREGLLFERLSPEVRALDPLLVATREEGRLQGRFPEHGDLIHAWIAPLFSAEAPEDARLRHAACLLADIAWRAHPEFRAERGLDIALHGNWVGLDARGRAMIAHALAVNFGGSGCNPVVAGLLAANDIARAERWGLALRLGQRLSGGVAGGLETSRLALGDGSVRLHIARKWVELYGESVERRLKALAIAMGCLPELVAD